MRKALTPEMQSVFIFSSSRFDLLPNTVLKFYNLALFMSSVAVFSLMAQRMSGGKSSLMH